MNEIAAIPSNTRTTALTVRTLRKLFLTLFLRGRMSRGFRKETAPKAVWQKLGLTLGFHALFGVILSVSMHGETYVLSLYQHAVTTMLVSMFIVVSAGDVLFNKEEAEILMHRPVSSRILLNTKISVLVVVSLWLAMAFNLGALVVGAFSGSVTIVYPVVHLFSVALETGFCAGLVVLLYQLCLRWFGREKLDSVMTIVQIVAGIGFFAITQIIPRMLERSSDLTVRLPGVWWMGLLPPAWFAGIDDAIAGSGGVDSWIKAGAALCTTFLVAWLAFVRLADTYEQGLQKISEAQSRSPKRVKDSRRLQRLTELQPFRWWLGDSISRAAFVLCVAHLLRDRGVKLRVFPGIAPMLVLPIIFLWQSQGGEIFGIAMASGFVGAIPLLGLQLMQYSDQWLASDVFRVAPLAGPAALCNGARHAVLLILTLPMVLVLMVVVIIMHGIDMSLLIMVPGFLSIPVLAMVPGSLTHAVPLTIAGDEAQAARRGLKMIVFMLFPIALAALSRVAWEFSFFPLLLAVETVLGAIAYWLMRRKTMALRWSAID